METQPPLSKFARYFQSGPRLLALSTGTVFVLFIIFRLFFIPSYLTNDDAVFTLLVSGQVISDSPDEHIYPTNLLIGKALKVLYALGWDVPWYGYYIFSTHFFSMTALLYALLKYRPSLIRFFFSIAYFFTVEFVLLMFTHFTTTAYVSAQAGIFLLVLSLGEKRKGWLLASSAALLFFSSLIRPDGLFLTLLLSVPLFVFILSANYNKKNIGVFVSFFVAIIALSLAAGRLNDYHYEKDKRWNTFLKYSDPLEEFVDNQTAVFVPETGHIFEKAGWSQNDYYMLTYWFSSDEDVFSLSKMKAIVSEFPPYKRYVPLKYVFSPVKVMLKDRSVQSITIFFILLSLCAESRKFFFVLLATAAVVCGVSVYLIFFKKLPEHVYLILFAHLASLSLFFTRPDFTIFALKRRRHIIRALFIASLLALSTASVDHYIKLSRSNSLEHQIYMRDTSKMAQRDAVSSLPEDRLFVAWNYRLEKLVSPFENIDYPPGFRMYWLSLLVHSPVGDKTLEEFGITDIYKDLYEKNNVFLISNEMLNVFYAKYILQHYGAVVSTPAYFRFGDYGVYKPVRVR